MLCIIAGGIGDAILGVNAAILLQKKYRDKTIDVLACVRDQVYEPLSYLFGGLIRLYQHPEKERLAENDGHLIINERLLNKEFPHKEKICIWPDLLFRAKDFSFDYLKYGVSYQSIRDYRSLTDEWKPQKRVYLGLNTSTPQYKYSQIPELLKQLAKTLPDYEIYFNNLATWGGQNIDNGIFTDLPPNIIYRENENFITSLGWLKKSCYCVCVDNGISHISRNLSIPRLLITPHLTINSLKWTSRWYPDLTECITYGHHPALIAALIKINLECPQTQLVPRDIVINNLSADWSKVLGFKY